MTVRPLFLKPRRRLTTFAVLAIAVISFVLGVALGSVDPAALLP